MSEVTSAIYSSIPNLKSLNVNIQSTENIKKHGNHRHSISDFRGIDTSQFQQSTHTSQVYSKQHSSQILKSPEEHPVITNRNISSVNIANLTEDNNKVMNSSEWISGMPLTPVGSIMFDDAETSIVTTSTMQQKSDYSDVTAHSMESLATVEECITPATRQFIISSESKKIFLRNKINSIIHDLINIGIFGIKKLSNQNIEVGTIYEFITTSLKNKSNPVDSLCDRIILELNALLSLVEDNNYESVKEIIDWLIARVSFKNIISSFSSNNELLNFLRPVILNNVRQSINNNDIHVSIEEFNKLEELLLIYCLTIGRLTIDTNSYENIDISLENIASVNKPIWRTSCSHIIDKMLSPTAMLMLHMVYWAMTIANSTAEGYVSNNFPNENIIGTIMAVYCSIAITHGSLMNSIRIYRSGKNNSHGSKPLMWSSILLNTLKDATSLGGSVLSLINIPPYIPIFQAGNIMFSTLFAEALVLRAKEANKGHFNAEKLKLFAPIILLPGLLLGSTSIVLPYCIPNICKNLFGYSGGDTNFLTHSLRSLVSNLLTASSEGLKEANRILVLSSVCASISVTTWMFVDIHRCEHRQLKQELQSFKGYLIFRYLVTAFTALFSMADPYAPKNNIIKKATSKFLTPSSPPAQTINSTTASSLSTSITTEIAEKVGALYVFLSTCDTGKGIIWEPRVGEFNRKAIKSVLQSNQLSNLRNQFQDSVFNQLSQVNSTEDYLKIVVKAVEEIGFSEKLEKLQATDFEPDLVDVLNTFRNIITAGKTNHHPNRLNIDQLFNHSEENDSLLNESERNSQQRANGRFTVVVVNHDELSSNQKTTEV